MDLKEPLLSCDAPRTTALPLPPWHGSGVEGPSQVHSADVSRASPTIKDSASKETSRASTSAVSTPSRQESPCRTSASSSLADSQDLPNCDSSLRLDAILAPDAKSLSSDNLQFHLTASEDTRFLRQLSVADAPRKKKSFAGKFISSPGCTSSQLPLPDQIRFLRQISGQVPAPAQNFLRQISILTGSPRCNVIDPEEPVESLKLSVEDKPDEPLTVHEAVYTMLNWTMCSPVLSIPVTFARCGFSSGLLILGAACVCMYTAMLLGNVLQHLGSKGISQPTFMDAAKLAFGSSGCVLVSSVSYLEFPAVVVSSFILQGSTLDDMLPGLGFNNVVFMTTALTAVMLVLSDKVYAYVSALSVLAFLVVCATVLVSGWELPEWAEDTRMTGNVSELPSSFSIILFTGAIHPLLPQLYSCTKSSQDYQKATCTAFAIWSTSILAFGGAAFYMYGDAIQAIATRNVGRDLQMEKIPSLQRLASLAGWLIVFKTQLSSRSYVSPVSDLFLRYLGFGEAADRPALATIGVSLPFLAGCAGTAICLKDRIEAVLAFSGMFLQNFNGIVFPSLMYLLICKPERNMHWMAALLSTSLGLMLILGAGVLKMSQ